MDATGRQDTLIMIVEILIIPLIVQAYFEIPTWIEIFLHIHKFSLLDVCCKSYLLYILQDREQSI